jgi:16S rRNA (cytosine967-C5)-methyltransferase
VAAVKGTAPGARELALQALLAVEEGGSYANLNLPQTQGLDGALAHELISGVTRRRATLDWVLGRLLTRPIKDLTPSIRNILRLGAYQLLFLDRVPARAAVDESVKLAHRFGHAGVAKLVNGVLRNLDRRRDELELPTFADDPLGALEHRYALPAWIAKRWFEAYGAEAEKLGLWSITRPHLALRVNTLRVTQAEVLAKLASAGISAEPSSVVPEGIRLLGSFDVTALPGYNEGWWYVQDEAAMLVSRCVDPKPGETIIDVGAAPGGKTTHLAQLMGNVGELWAIDQRASRMRLVEENLARLGVTIVRTEVRDAADTSGMPQADRILLDVPCSGLGVLPRKPDLRWRQDEAEGKRLAKIQRVLLEAATKMLKPGGTLVYSTCTIGPTENQDVVKGFLSDHPNYSLGDLAPFLPASWASEIEERGMIQILPQRHGVDGFFIARLQAPGG